MTAQDSSLRMLIGNITGDLNHLCDSSADIEIDRTITGNIVSVHISTGDYTVTVTPRRKFSD